MNEEVLSVAAPLLRGNDASKNERVGSGVQ